MKSIEPLSPQHIAKAAADRYFAELAADLPFDTAPGGINLVAACVNVQDAILRMTGADRGPVDPEDAALRAGYLLGVEIGRRMGGAR